MKKTKPIAILMLTVITVLILAIQPNNGNANPLGMFGKEIMERLFKMALNDVATHEKLQSMDVATGTFYVNEAYERTKAEIEKNYSEAVDRINEKYSYLNELERNSPKWKSVLQKATADLEKAKHLYRSHLRAIKDQRSSALRIYLPIWQKNKLPNNDNML